MTMYNSDAFLLKRIVYTLVGFFGVLAAGYVVRRFVPAIPVWVLLFPAVYAGWELGRRVPYHKS